MFISSVILNNFRSYKGVNKVDFTQGSRNVFLIAGNNGFGKTTFLTSLVWCLYGKLIVDVDDKYRREINDERQGLEEIPMSLASKTLQPGILL